MNGAESLVATLAGNGVEVCFANPGTSEMHFVAALDRVPGVRCVLSLFEGVATGAADGYWRMSGKPAATLLHLGPGLANGGANLHNARKAQSGILNIVGDHATDHLAHESPLRSDVEAIAAPFSHWVESARTSASVADSAARAIAATRHGSIGRIATLVLPADTAWGPGVDKPAVAEPSAPGAAPDGRAVDAAAATLRRAGSAATLLLGGGAMTDPPALRLAFAIGRATGCNVLSEFYSARISAGRGRQRIERLPYAVDAAVARLAGTRPLVLAGAAEPIAFFAYPGKRSMLAPDDCETQRLADASADVPAALRALAEALGIDESKELEEVAAPTPADLSQAGGPLTADFVGQAVAALLPADAVVVDEAISSGRHFAGLFTHAAPHDWLAVMGGAIGFGLPAAVGAAIGAPGRAVVALEGDGSGMYTLQALWTMARENLPVVVVIFANRAYRILQGELAGVGATISGPKARDMLALDRPALDWVALARGMGLEAARVDTPGDFLTAFTRAIDSRGPALVEAVI